MTWWPALLGWPAIALSTVLTILGFRRRNEYLVLAALFPVFPVGLYILGSPILWWLPIVITFGLLVSGWSIRRKRRAADARNKRPDPQKEQI